MPLSGRDAAAYVLAKMGCLHPFTLSRILALADLKSLEERGERLTQGLTYVAGPGVFYIEELHSIIDGDECFVKHEGDPKAGRPGCIEYQCEPPRLSEEEKRILDEAIEQAKKLSMEELNRLVTSHKLYGRLTGGE